MKKPTKKVIKKKPVMKKPTTWQPKRGVARLKKRPARHEKQQQDALYTRSTSKPKGLRREHMVPTRSLNDFVTFRGDRDIVRIMKHDKLIRTPQKTDKCSLCGSGMTPATYHPSLETWGLRCRSMQCRKRVDSLGNHPFLVHDAANGLGSQALLLLHFIHKVPLVSSHFLLNMPHATAMHSEHQAYPWRC